jgi:RND family efflux transporter MFP subunit
MKNGKWPRALMVITAIAAVSAIAYGAFEYGKRFAADAGLPDKIAPDGNNEPVATIQVATIRQDRISEQLEFYGTIVVQQSEVSYVSVPLESLLKRILVTPGQRVGKNDNLFELDLSPSARLAIEQAKINASAAQAELQQTQQRLAEQIATNQELNQARQAAELASGAVTQLEQLYAQAVGLHPAGFDGVVNKIDAQPGQIVAPGSPIIEVVSDDGIEVELGIEIEDVRMLSRGSSVRVSSVLADKPHDVQGTIRLTTEAIDRQTQLTTIYVALPAKAGFMLGETVKALVEIQTPPGLIVPREAVIPDGPTDVVYVIEDGKAVEKRVRSGVDNGSEMEVFASDLKPGDRVATLGNSQLADGMLVRIAGAINAAPPVETLPVPERSKADRPGHTRQEPRH